MQRTFGEIVGLDLMVPVRRHPYDIVHCINGKAIPHCEVFYDCRDFPWADQDLRHEADVSIVTEILDAGDKWATDYCTGNCGNDDYASGYAYIVDEVSHDWPRCVEEWVRDTHDDWSGHSKYDYCMKELVSAMCEALDGAGNDVECEYTHDYVCYSGSGCCLYSLDVGEYENQIEVNGHPELKDLHDQGRLDDVLDDYKGDSCVNRSRRRVKNEKTGYYEEVGRETYMPYEHHDKCPTFCTYHNIGGNWHYTIDADRMAEVLIEAIITIAGKV